MRERELVERRAAVVVAVVAALRIYSIQCEQQTVNKHEQQPPLNHCCSVPDNSSLMCSKCTYYYCLLYLYNRIDVRTRRTHCTHAYEYIYCVRTAAGVLLFNVHTIHLRVFLFVVVADVVCAFIDHPGLRG